MHRPPPARQRESQAFRGHSEEERPCHGAGSSMERGPSSFSGIFYKQKNVLLRSCVGPTWGQGTNGTRAGLGEFAFPGVTWAPCPVSPPGWAPRLEGRGQRSRQAESSRWAPLPVAKPRVPQNSDKWSQGGLAGSGQLDWCQGLRLKRVSCGAGAQLCPPHLSACSLPGAGPSSPAAGGTYSVLTLLCHQLGEFSKRSQCSIAPTPQPRTGLPFPGISEPRVAGP